MRDTFRGCLGINEIALVGGFANSVILEQTMKGDVCAFVCESDVMFVFLW